MNQDALPCSTTGPVECLADPVAYLARKLEQDPDDIKVVSMEVLQDQTVKIRFYLLRS